jgi:hypothetical protein
MAQEMTFSHGCLLKKEGFDIFESNYPKKNLNLKKFGRVGLKKV